MVYNIFWITDVVIGGKLLYKNSNGLGQEVSVCAGEERERSSPWTEIKHCPKREALQQSLHKNLFLLLSWSLLSLLKVVFV